MNEVFRMSGRMDWGTPMSVFGPLHDEFHFTVDVCASANTAKCADYYDGHTKNGLLEEWNGVCWMNPPYGKWISRWVTKAHTEAASGRCTVVGLIPSRTETSWWHDHIQGIAEVRFVRGRIKFEGAKWNAPFPSAVIVWRSGCLMDLRSGDGQLFIGGDE